jgi:hypothetical protein
MARRRPVLSSDSRRCRSSCYPARPTLSCRFTVRPERIEADVDVESGAELPTGRLDGGFWRALLRR